MSSDAPAAKPAGRTTFAESIRAPDELKNGLIWLFDTDTNQLAAFLRSGPMAGRTKLLFACAKAVHEPPNRPPSDDTSSSVPASSQSPPAAASSTDATTVPSAPVASGTPAAAAAPAASSDVAKGAKVPQRGETDASTSKDADKPGADVAPVASSGGADASAATSDPLHPPGVSGTADDSSAQTGPSAPDGTSPAPSRFDHVAPPTFLDASEIPRKAKVSTRQVLCCRETCSVCFQACCGYSSELPRDSHFESDDVHHRCKACYRASRASKTADAPSSSSTAQDASQDAGGSWHYASQDSGGSWQPSSGWHSSQGRWEWDSWNGQWTWY